MTLSTLDNVVYVLQLNEAKLFRGFGGEVMRKAVICLIERAALSKLPFHNDPVIG